MNDRIYRAREDRMFLGVLGGFSLRVGVDPSIVRVAYAIVTVLTGIVPLVIVYFVMAVVIPEAPPGYEAAARAASATGAPPASWTPPPPAAGWPPAGSAAPAAPPAAVPPTTAPGAPPPGVASTPIAAPGPGSAPAPGPPPAWGAGWDASGRPTTGETARHEHDARTGAAVGGLVLVGLGGAFLLAQVAPQLDWGIVGPVLMIALGAVLVLASLRRT